jgi:hypothetical protein
MRIKNSDRKVVSFAPVLEAAILASGDVFIASQQIPLPFNTGEGYELESVIVLDKADQNQAFDLIFSTEQITLGTLNAAISITDADAEKIIGSCKMVVATHAYDLINSILFTQGNLGIVLQGSALWVAAVCRSGTPTYGAAGMTMKFGFK